MPATSPDGIWSWDGREWWTSVAMDRANPMQLASALHVMADQRFLQAGTLLARRRRSWSTPDEIALLVDEAHFMLRQLDAIDSRLTAIETLLGSRWLAVLGWLSGSAGERRELRDRRERLRGRLRDKLIAVGEGAQRPTTKEADEVLAGARRLRQLGRALAAAVEASTAAGQGHQDGVGTAEAALERAERARWEAIRDAEQEIDYASAAREEAIEAARHELALASIGRAGEPVASCLQMQLSEHRVETPDGVGPADGARALLDTAGALWREEQPLLSRMLEVDCRGAREFHEAEASGRPDLFLLVVTDLVKSVVQCPPTEEDAAGHFAREVNRVSGLLAAARPEREATLQGAREELQSRLNDRSAVEAAEARLAAVKSDSALLEAIEAAKQRAEEVRADETDLRRTEDQISEVMAEIATPPEPLRAALTPSR
jgi:hypothetical protein